MSFVSGICKMSDYWMNRWTNEQSRLSIQLFGITVNISAKYLDPDSGSNLSSGRCVSTYFTWSDWVLSMFLRGWSSIHWSCWQNSHYLHCIFIPQVCISGVPKCPGSGILGAQRIQVQPLPVEILKWICKHSSVGYDLVSSRFDERRLRSNSWTFIGWRKWGSVLNIMAMLCLSGTLTSWHFFDCV